MNRHVLSVLVAALSLLMLPIAANAQHGGGHGGGHSSGHSSGHSGSSGKSSGHSAGSKSGSHSHSATRHSASSGSRTTSSHHARHSTGATRAHHTVLSHRSSSYVGPRDANGRIHRSETAKHEFMKETGYPHGRPGYVIDHIVPLAKGGLDRPSNMQWQTTADAKAKDKWERK